MTNLGEPRKRRYSLLTLLLTLTIAAMAIALWQLGREVVPLKQEVRRLKAAAGELEITEPDRAAAIGLRADEEMTWRWRIYLPLDRQYQLVARCNKIPVAQLPSRLPSGEQFVPLPAVYLRKGEQIITVRVGRDGDNPALVTTLETESQAGRPLKHTQMSLLAHLPDYFERLNGGTWPNGRTGPAMTFGTEGVTRTQPSDDPHLLLLHHRVGRNNSIGGNEPSLDGLMIWLEDRGEPFVIEGMPDSAAGPEQP